VATCSRRILFEKRFQCRDGFIMAEVESRGGGRNYPEARGASTISGLLAVNGNHTLVGTGEILIVHCMHFSHNIHCLVAPGTQSSVHGSCGDLWGADLCSRKPWLYCPVFEKSRLFEPALLELVAVLGCLVSRLEPRRNYRNVLMF